MTSLLELQRSFWNSVRTQPRPEDLETLFVSRGRMNGAQRLGIYRTAYWVRQVSALRELFPSVVRALGDGPFAQTASRYLARYPSSQAALEGLGDRFPAWLEPAELREAASIDFARWSVFVAVDEPLLRSPPGALAQATLRLAQHVAVLPVSTRGLALAGVTFEVPVTQASTLALWREGFIVHQRLVSPAEAGALRLARTGLSFEAFCAQVGAGADTLENAAQLALVTFSQWLSRGWLVEVT